MKIQIDFLLRDKNTLIHEFSCIIRKRVLEMEQKPNHLIIVTLLLKDKMPVAVHLVNMYQHDRNSASLEHCSRVVCFCISLYICNYSH